MSPEAPTLPTRVRAGYPVKPPGPVSRWPRSPRKETYLTQDVKTRSWPLFRETPPVPLFPNSDMRECLTRDHSHNGCCHHELDLVVTSHRALTPYLTLGLAPPSLPPNTVAQFTTHLITVEKRDCACCKTICYSVSTTTDSKDDPKINLKYGLLRSRSSHLRHIFLSLA